MLSVCAVALLALSERVLTQLLSSIRAKSMNTLITKLGVPVNIGEEFPDQLKNWYGSSPEDLLATLSVCDSNSNIFSNVRRLVLIGASMSPVCMVLGLWGRNELFCPQVHQESHMLGSIGQDRLWLAWWWGPCIPAMHSRWPPRPYPEEWRTASRPPGGCSASHSCLTNWNFTYTIALRWDGKVLFLK